MILSNIKQEEENITQVSFIFNYNQYHLKEKGYSLN